MVYRLISNVVFSRTRSEYATYTNKRHHGISADMLEIKLSIGIDKANRTLRYTTQDNVISALKPLTCQYRTYFLLQRLHQLNFRFYTNVLFAKDKSIVGNTCAPVWLAMRTAMQVIYSTGMSRIPS